MIRDLFREHPLWWWLLYALAIVVIGYVGVWVYVAVGTAVIEWMGANR